MILKTKQIHWLWLTPDLYSQSATKIKARHHPNTDTSQKQKMYPPSGKSLCSIRGRKQSPPLGSIRGRKQSPPLSSIRGCKQSPQVQRLFSTYSKPHQNHIQVPSYLRPPLTWMYQSVNVLSKNKTKTKKSCYTWTFHVCPIGERKNTKMADRTQQFLQANSGWHKHSTMWQIVFDTGTNRNVTQTGCTWHRYGTNTDGTKEHTICDTDTWHKH